MSNFFILNNGISIPSQGLGTYTLNKQTMISSLSAAYESGCKLIDTASAYGNEGFVGNAIKVLEKEGVFTRNDLFIQTKVGDKIDDLGHPIGYYFYNSPSCPCHDTKKIVNEQIANSLKLLNTDYLDLVMIHWPYYDVLNEIWSSLEDLYEQKVIRSIGVSNCKKRHLERIMRTAKYVPMVNQINISPINTCEEDYDFCFENKIALQAYSPLYTIQYFRGNEDCLINKIASRCQKSSSQIVLRWYYQRGIIAIPKSSSPTRVKENCSIYDFELTSSEMDSINSLNCNFNYLVESTFCPGY